MYSYRTDDGSIMLVDVDKNATRALVNGEDVRDVRAVLPLAAGRRTDTLVHAGDRQAAPVADVQGLRRS